MYFKTDKGSFSSGSVVRTASATTATSGSNTGTATASLYPIFGSGEYGSAHVQVTDDSAPLAGDNANDDPYNFDWVQISTITIYAPYYNLALQAVTAGSVCEDQKTITALLTLCGYPRGEETVTFSTTNGTFLESGTSTTQATTSSAGTATATLVRPEACKASQADVSATSTVAGFTASSNTVHVTWQSWKLKVTITPYWAVSGTPASVKGKLTLEDGTTAVTGQSVTLSTDQGVFANSQTTYTADTDQNGEINTTLTVGTCPVTATVIGTTIALPCNCTFTDSNTLRVVCCQTPATPCEIFFCIDCTGSMGSTSGSHRATASIEKFLQNLTNQQVIFRLGGVKFNEPGIYSQNETILISGQYSQLQSLSSFTNVSNFISSWVNNTYSPSGGDTPELQLDALDLAVQDMNAYSTAGNPNRYIVLITDNAFHFDGDVWGYTGLTKSQVENELTNSGCRVYISLWEDPTLTLLRNTYDGLQVNAGEFDPCNWYASAAADKYPLVKLMARIISDWPSN